VLTTTETTAAGLGARRTVPVARWIGLAVAGLGLVVTTVAALGIGYPDGTGIVEEGTTTAGERVLILAILAGIPAVVLGVADGLLALVPHPGPRSVGRVVLVGGLGWWAGLLVYAFASLACDGSCLEVERGPVVASALAGVGVVAVEVAIAAGVGRMVGRRSRSDAPA
jgi:hypothetical protein